VGGGAVSVAVGWVGVDDGKGEGSTVALGSLSTSTGAAVVGEPVLQPAKIIINRREIITRFNLSSVISFMSGTPEVEGSGNYNRQILPLSDIYYIPLRDRVALHEF
jgi:hypothetical protein